MIEEIVIYGNSAGPALPKSDLRETDPKKGSYVLGRELIGNIPDLKTENKGSLVGAINEIAEMLGGIENGTY